MSSTQNAPAATLNVVHTSYSLQYASRGANVVVNDFNAEAAQKVVDEIAKGVCALANSTPSRDSVIAGGKAVANNSSVTDGASVIKTALDTFGSVHVLINNAGILRDKKYVPFLLLERTRLRHA